MKLPHSNFIRVMKKKAGEPPGILLPPGETGTEKTKISLITFSENEFREEVIDDVETLTASINQEVTTWLHLSGFSDIEIFRKLGELYSIDSLALEDILNHEHMPKAEDSTGHLFVTLKHLQRQEENGDFIFNPISMVLYENMIITFARYQTAVFDTFINRIRQATGKIRQRKADYLLYRLVDIITDNYYPVFEDFENELFRLESEIENDANADIGKQITTVKKEIYQMKKLVLPTWEALQSLMKMETPLLKKSNLKFFNDVSDHLRHLLQLLDSYRETSFMLMELHHANNANKMNEVMKTLTIIATIFIPLTFIAGVYGMNFQYMPELAYRWAYPLVMVLMFTVALVMVFYMKRKKWF